MKKLALNIDELSVQSFETTADVKEMRCTVRGYMDDDNGGDGGGDYSDVCSGVCRCADWETCSAGCVEPQRRIILSWSRRELRRGRSGDPGRPFSFSRTLALSHSRTLALSHSRTPALPHSRTPARPHAR